MLVAGLTTIAAVSAGWGSYRLASQEQHRTVEISLTERTERLEGLLMDIDDPFYRWLPTGSGLDASARPDLSGGVVPSPVLTFVNDVSGGDVSVRLVDRPDPGDDWPGRVLLVDLINDRSAELVLPEADLATPGMTTQRWYVEGVPHRLCITVLDDGSAIYVARSLAEAESTLRSVRRRLIMVLLPVIVLSGLLGWFGARRLARPLEGLAASADHVTRTGQLDVDFQTEAPGEVGTVARSIGSMLDSLSHSRHQQQRLVADAGHELRTPLTALRVNAELLASGRLSEADARQAASAIVAETGELSALAGELVELASVAADVEQRSMIDLGEIAERVAANARRRYRTDISVDGRAAPMLGHGGQIERAISNLVDNAVKFAPVDAPIAIRVDSTSVAVVDHGPGIDEHDLGLLFGRFYRSPEARSLPGSGLGLAIVDKVARDHGGRPFARNHANGATVGFTMQRNFDPAKHFDLD